MSKVSKIDQIHLRAVMLCMSKMSKMYIKGVLRYINTRDQSNVEDVEEDIKGVLRYINTRDQSNVEGVEDRSNTPKGCNAMYVEDVEDVH